MRKLVSFFLIFSILLTPLFAKEFTIQTSRGEKTVVIPEGFTVEEAFLEMSVLYLEERFDHEDLLFIVDSLNEEVASYIRENEELNILYKEALEKSKEIITIYKDTSKKKIIGPMFGFSLNSNLEFSIDAGVTIIEMIDISAMYLPPKTFGLRLGFRF